MAHYRGQNQRITADIVPMDTDSVDDPEEDPVIFHVPQLKRNLLGDFGRPSVMGPPVTAEHMKVYLRIRPFSAEEIDRNENKECLKMECDKTVTTDAPPESHSFKNMARGYGKATTKYTFSHIFGEDKTQKEFFSETMLGLVKDFIDGQNCLVFSYGVTNSGKTYTIQGKPQDAGVLPRALDVLFNSISGRQWEGTKLKPTMFSNVIPLSAEQEVAERAIKERVMKMSCENDLDMMSLLGTDRSDMSGANTTTCSESSNVSMATDKKDSLDDPELLLGVEERVREEAKVSMETQSQIKFSVYVSFAEIYNEQMFDLLEPMKKKKNAHRPCLKLREDQDGSPYINGLKYIHVTSADEAYQLLTIGQRNLQTACTKLNHNSSRSHCIFNIKILRVLDVDDPSVSHVSMLSLCDLAGSERSSKTQNVGDRIKETGHINTSLLTLGRCLDTLRYNQTHKENRIIPFRESKLTRLFQNFFMGRGKAAMFVNVNQCASMFDETQHVFKFSAIASQVEIRQKPVFVRPKLPVTSQPPIPRATSISWATPARMRAGDLNTAENVPIPESDDDLEDDEEPTYTQANIDELLDAIEALQRDLIKETREKERIESEVRAEVCREMAQQFAVIEKQTGERIRRREEIMEELAEERIQILMNAQQQAKAKQNPGTHPDTMVDEDDEWVSSIVLHQEKVKVQKLEQQLKEAELKLSNMDQGTQEISPDAEAQISQLQRKVGELEDKLASVSETQTDQRGVENLIQHLEQSRAQIREHEKEIVDLNDMLTEAGETFAQKEAEIDKLKKLVGDYELKMEGQEEANRVLERAAADSKVAMDTADQSLCKRTEKMESLQAEIRDLEGDVNKYRNKARFFEEQLLTKEEESTQWKNKYETDRLEHSKSQEALIHGFSAEIKSLKSQIFNVKSQLHTAKSPVKSPGKSLKSPDCKFRLFPMSETKSPSRVLPCLPTNLSGKESGSPARSQDYVNEQVKAVQTELDKNSAMTVELEHALHISKAAIEELEKKLQAESERCAKSDVRIVELEALLSETENCDRKQKNEGEDHLKEKEESENLLRQKSEELQSANEKVKELEPLMKDYFSKSKQLSDAEKKVKGFDEIVEEKNKEINAHSGRIAELEKSVTEYSRKLEEKELFLDEVEKRLEEMDMANSEVKDIVTETQTMESASQEDSSGTDGKSEGEQVSRSDKIIEKLRQKLKEAIKSCKTKGTLLKEAVEKCKVLEFRIDEIEIDSDDFKTKQEESNQRLCDSECKLKEKAEELVSANQKLENAILETEKFRTTVTDYKSEKMKLNAEIKSLNDRYDSVLKEKNELQDILSQKEHDETSKKELVSLEGKLKEVQERLVDMEIQNHDLKETCLQLNSVKEEVLKQNALLLDKDKTIVDLSNNLRTFEETKKDLENIVRERKELVNEIETLKEKILEKNEEIMMFSQNLDAVLEEKENCESSQEHVDELKQQLVKTHEQLKEKELLISKLTSSFEKLNQDNEKMISQQKKIIEQEDLIKELQKKTQILAGEGNADALECSVHELESVVADKEVELCEKDRTIEELSRDMNKFKHEKEKKEQELNSQEIELLRVKDSNVELAQRCTNAEAELSVKQKIMAEKDNEIENWRCKMEDVEKKLEHKQEELSISEKCNREQRQEFDKKLAMEISANMLKINVLEKEFENVSNAKETAKAAEHSKLHELEESLAICKKNLAEREEELCKVKQEIDCLLTKNRDLEKKVNSLGEEKQESVMELKRVQYELDANRKEVEEAKKDKNMMNELKAQLTLKEVECETLRLELKVMNDKLEVEKNESQRQKQRVGSIQKYFGSEDSESQSVDGAKTEKLDELQRMYEAEKLKSEEYQKLLIETNEPNCLSPHTGIRKIRKQKIEAENALIEANFKIETLERKIRDLDSKQKCDTNSNESVPTHDPLLQRKLNSVVAKLSEAEGLNQNLIEENTKLQVSVETLEADLNAMKHEEPVEREMHRRSRASMLSATPRQSINSPSTALELNKSRDREERLREQLKLSNQTIQEWRVKLADAESKLASTVNSLQVKTQELHHALDTVAGLKNYKKDNEEHEKMVKLLKDTLAEQENMLQEQEDYVKDKETQLQTSQRELEDLQVKYKSLQESTNGKTQEHLAETRTIARLEGERDLLRQQLRDSDQRQSMQLHDTEQKLKQQLCDTEKQLIRVTQEKERLMTVVTENNKELKAMERSLTESRHECEELKSLGADAGAENKLEMARREAEKTVHDLNTKIRTLQCHNKEVMFKLSAADEKLSAVTERAQDADQKLQEFRAERDKLVSGLEAVLKKKDMEIKQLMAVIQQLKDKEIQMMQTWQGKRDQIATGLQELQTGHFTVKTEPEDVPESPVKELTPDPEIASNARLPASRQNSRDRPPRPAAPRSRTNSAASSTRPVSSTVSANVDGDVKTEIQTWSESPGRNRRSVRSQVAQPSASSEDQSQRPSSRRGRKRTSPVVGVEDISAMPPVAKRRSMDKAMETSMLSETSEDYSSHLQIDATPPVAAKTLKRTRKKTASNVDLTKTDEQETQSRPQRRSKRSAKARILESFRESPMGKTSKRILDNIAETFSPRSPTKSPSKSPKRDTETNEPLQKGKQRARLPSKENIPSTPADALDVSTKQSSRSGRVRHKLYKDISEPFEATGDFVNSPENENTQHRSVLRSLRSRRN